MVVLEEPTSCQAKQFAHCANCQKRTKKDIHCYQAGRKDIHSCAVLPANYEQNTHECPKQQSPPFDESPAIDARAIEPKRGIENNPHWRNDDEAEQVVAGIDSMEQITVIDLRADIVCDEKHRHQHNKIEADENETIKFRIF